MNTYYLNKTYTNIICLLNILQRNPTVMKRIIFSYSVILILGLSAICLGQQNEKTSVSNFLQQAAIFGLNGTSVSQFAITKLNNNQLASYAVSAHNDYARVNLKLLALADKKDIDLPDLASDSSAIMEVAIEDNSVSNANEGPLRLKNPLDLSYLKMMIEDFQTAISYYESNLDTDDTDLKQHVLECLPIFKKNIVEAISFTQPVLAKE